MDFSHYSVLLNETIEGLLIKPDGVYVDGTLGGAGHSSVIASKLKAGTLIGIDQDEAAIEAASQRLSKYKDVCRIVRNNYENMACVVKEQGFDGVDGIVLDLGVSSYQLDTVERGFSYRFDTQLDMRMDRRQSLTARTIVNDYPEMELFHIIRDYGEDKFAKNIAKHIVKARACNRELEVLENSLESMIDLLNPGGRLCIITFHSLEDRIVKHAFKTAQDPCICPREFPVCTCGRVSKGTIITRKPILPSEQELAENSRSKSAKLRIFEKK